MAAVELGVAADGGDRCTLRRRHPRGRAGAAAGAHRAARAAQAARDLPGRHASLHRCASTATAMAAARCRIRFALTRTEDDRFIFDATETDDQARGPVNFLMNRDVPGMALGLYFLGGDPDQVVQCRRPARDRRGAAARGFAAAAALPRAARHARHDDDARARGAERPDQRRRPARPGRAFRLRHHSAERHRGGPARS